MILSLPVTQFLMKRVISIAIVFLVCFFDKNNCVAQNIQTIYLNQKDSLSNFYIIVSPEKLPIKSFMFLIPSFNEAPQNVLLQTDIPKIAAKKGILTIIPTFKTGSESLGIDNATQNSFKEIFTDAVKLKNLSGLKFYLGGFSIGGSSAIKFAENAFLENAAVKPSAVFAIDPPLDFERFYRAAKRNIRLSKNTQPNEEAVYFVNRIKKETGGTPENNIKNYYRLSPYSFNDTAQTAVKNLVSVPLRLYSEPDIDWWLKERGTDYYGMNVFDQSAMINELNKLGNNKATLVVTLNKGYRKPNNHRHPHSWSIAEPNELIAWLLAQ